MKETRLFRLVRTLNEGRAKLGDGSLDEFGETYYLNKVTLIERRLKTQGLNPNLPNLGERAFYVEHGIDEVDQMLFIMGSEHADELIPEYIDYYGIKDIPLTASGLRIIADGIAKKEDAALPYMAARLTYLCDIEKREILIDCDDREKWNLINALIDRDIDPYDNPVMEALVRNSARSVRRLLPMLEAGGPDERIRAIKELGARGIIESDPRVLRYWLDPYEAEPVLSSRDLYLIASNPDWEEITRDAFWGNQADGTPYQTKYGHWFDRTTMVDQNPDWREIALSRKLERYGKLDTP